MQLYYAPNTIAVAVAIALEEAGLPYEPCLVDFATGAQLSPGYLRINSKARVPALAADGQILTETGALLEFVAARAPGAGLVPADAVDAARMRSVMYYLASTMHVNHAHGPRGQRWADHDDSLADMAAKVPETMTASARYLEDECLGDPYVLGATFSLADAYLFTVCTWLEGDGVDLEPFARIRAHRAAMEARDAVKAVRAKGILT